MLTTCSTLGLGLLALGDPPRYPLRSSSSLRPRWRPNVWWVRASPRSTHLTERPQRSQSILRDILLLGGPLYLGTFASLLYTSSSIFPSAGTILALSLVSSLIRTLPPLLALVSTELALRLVLAPTLRRQLAWLDLLLPALAFSLAGILQEYLGGGRSLWIVGGGVLEWAGARGGPVLVDFLWGLTAVAGAEVALAVWRTSVEEGHPRDLMHFGQDSSGSSSSSSSEDDDDDDQSHHIRESVRRHLHRQPKPPPPPKLPFLPPTPLLTILGILFLSLIVIPALPPASFVPTHPSPIAPDFRYPALKVACVAPSSQGVEDWIKETKLLLGGGRKC